MSALATIHIGRKALGLDDETYRDLLERVTGARSAAHMSPPQHRAVIDEMRRLGFDGGVRRGGKRLEGPFARKFQALWIAAWNLGLVEDRRDSALLAFVGWQTGLSHTRFLVDRRRLDRSRLCGELDGISLPKQRRAGTAFRPRPALGG